MKNDIIALRRKYQRVALKRADSQSEKINNTEEIDECLADMIIAIAETINICNLDYKDVWDHYKPAVHRMDKIDDLLHYLLRIESNKDVGLLPELIECIRFYGGEKSSVKKKSKDKFSK